MSRSRWAIPLALLIASAVASGAVMFEPVSVARPLITTLFIGLCPGLALVGLLRVEDWTRRLALSIAVSWSLATVVASISLYAGYWSSTAIFMILVAVTIVGSVAQMGQPPSPAPGQVDRAA